MWIEFGNEIYDIGNMYNIKDFDIPTKSPQYAIDEPFHLRNLDGDYNEFYLSLKNFDPLSFYKNAPRHTKSNNRKVMKKRNFLDSGLGKPIAI